jgi:hypothetical protein
MDTVTTPSRGLDPTAIHTVLKSERRRAVLALLHEQGGSATVKELSNYVAIEESGEDPPPKDGRQSAYVSLHQTHLPRLDDFGIIQYDTENRAVYLDENAPAVYEYLYEPFLDHQLWMVVVGVGVFGAGASATGIALEPSVSAYIAFALFSVIVLVSIYRLYRVRFDRL